VYFGGTARRGEDGDQTGKSSRRQPKPVKPKKMLRADGLEVVQVACNSGTSALVCKDGSLHLFGKDTSHADYATGLVTDLRGVQISQVCTIDTVK
jgi:E3 ubiquitin-protein ligase MYCBP2